MIKEGEESAGTMLIHEGVDDEWAELTKQAWTLSVEGKVEEAIEKYRLADEWGDTRLGVKHNPGLSVLRHNLGTASGRIVPPSQGENFIDSFAIRHIDAPKESPDAQGLKIPKVNKENLVKNITLFIAYLRCSIHRENIKKDLPHVQIISTGRCGTVSLFRLFEQSNLMAFHSFLWNPEGISQIEMMCRFMDGAFRSKMMPPEHFIQTRAAEWLGAINEDRPMVNCLHLDTIFAPVFANIHPLSKFVYLHRNPRDVFLSFYGKGQWNAHQIGPVFYDFCPEFKWRRVGYDALPTHAWYIYFVEQFCEAMLEVMGERAIKVSAEKLFAQDEQEIERLLSFTGCDLPLDRAVGHFRMKYNEKAYKLILTEEGIRILSDIFTQNYQLLQQHGHF